MSRHLGALWPLMRESHLPVSSVSFGGIVSPIASHALSLYLGFGTSLHLYRLYGDLEHRSGPQTSLSSRGYIGHGGRPEPADHKVFCKLVEYTSSTRNPVRTRNAGAANRITDAPLAHDFGLHLPFSLVHFKGDRGRTRRIKTTTRPSNTPRDCHIGRRQLMIDFGKNTVFILSAYGVSFLTLGTLVILTLRKPRR